MGGSLLAVLTGVTVVVVGAGALWLIRSLTDEDKREGLAERTKQRVCRHEWEKIPTDLGPNVIFVTADAEWCRKCGARR
jgi:hypothetical protein